MTWVLCLGAGLLVCAAVQVGVCRHLPSLGWLRSFFAGFAAGYPVTILPLLGLLAPVPPPFGGTAALFVASGLSYASCVFFYFNVINGGRSALRIRLLDELDRAPGGLTYDELRARYSPEEMYRTRLERMVGHGQVRRRGGRLHVGRPTLLFIARLVTLAKLVVTGRRSEFD